MVALRIKVLYVDDRIEMSIDKHRLAYKRLKRRLGWSLSGRAAGYHSGGSEELSSSEFCRATGIKMKLKLRGSKRLKH